MSPIRCFCLPIVTKPANLAGKIFCMHFPANSFLSAVYGIARYLCVLVTLAQGAVCAAELTVVTESLPPLNYKENGNATGYSVEIVEAVLQEARIQAPIEIMPWARAYQMALTQPNTLIFSITRLPDRDALFEWIGPISSRQIFLYKLKSRKDIQIRNMADAAAYKVGLVREMASTKEFLRTTTFPESGVDYAPTVESNIKKFLMGRVDLIVSQDWSAAYLMKMEGRKPDELEPVLLLDGVNSYYLAMQKQSDPALVQRIRRAFAKVQQSGLLEKLRLKYMR